jgi:hypothetical protein
VNCYNRKTKDSRFTNMEDSLLAKAVSMFVVPPMQPSVVVVSEPFVKTIAIVKRGFLRPSPEVSVASLSALVVMKDGV